MKLESSSIQILEIHNQLLSMWGIQDSLLQSYRNIFLTTQSVIFSLAVFTASGNNPLFSLLLCPIGIYVIYLWILICKNRGLDVLFLQWQLQKIKYGCLMRKCSINILEPKYEKENVCSQEFEKIDLFGRFKDWQGIDAKYRKKILLEDADGNKLIDLTRKKLEIVPYLFLVLWFFLVSCIIYSITK